MIGEIETGKYLEYIIKEVFPKGQIKKWLVRFIGGEIIGYIACGLFEYKFIPVDFCLCSLDPNTLREIADFCDRKTKEFKKGAGL